VNAKIFYLLIFGCMVIDTISMYTFFCVFGVYYRNIYHIYKSTKKFRQNAGMHIFVIKVYTSLKSLQEYKTYITRKLLERGMLPKSIMSIKAEVVIKRHL